MHVIVKDEFGGNTMYHRLLRLAVMTFAALLSHIRQEDRSTDDLFHRY